MAKALNLADGARSIVYKGIIDGLQADATLAGVTPAISWMTYLGETSHALPTNAPSFPAIETMPIGMPASQETQTRQNAPFLIRVIVTTPGIDIRDHLNLWDAIEKALFPGDASRALRIAIAASLAANAPPASLTSIELGQPATKTSGLLSGSSQVICSESYIIVNLMVRR